MQPTQAIITKSVQRAEQQKKKAMQYNAKLASTY